MYSGHDISKIILSYLNDAGDSITNKKLQKLLYYIEAWSLVYVGSLIKEDFEAWVHGPVIPSVYREYKTFGYSPICVDYECGEEPIERYTNLIAAIDLQQEHWDLIKSVLAQYGGLASFQLENLSHSEQPWMKARGDASPLDNSTSVIDKEVMRAYYSSLIESNGQKEEV